MKVSLGQGRNKAEFHLADLLIEQFEQFVVQGW